MDLSDRIIDHYERHARAWEADRRNSPWVDRPWHDRFISALPTDATVLDLGCGGGAPVAANMVGCGLRVTGVDASPTLVSLCRERMPDQEWIEADMRRLSLGRKFDGILAWDSFFHLKPDDQRQMFAVFATHGAWQATLMFNAGPGHGEAVASIAAIRSTMPAWRHPNTRCSSTASASRSSPTPSRTAGPAAAPFGWPDRAGRPPTEALP